MQRSCCACAVTPVIAASLRWDEYVMLFALLPLRGFAGRCYFHGALRTVTALPWALAAMVSRFALVFDLGSFRLTWKHCRFSLDIHLGFHNDLNIIF